MKKSTLRAIASLGIVLGTILGGCSGPQGGSLMKAGTEPDSDFGATIPGMANGQSITFGFIPLCVIDGKQVTILSASFDEATNLEVVDFAVNRPPFGDTTFGADKVSLAEAGFDSTQREVDSTCPTDGDHLGLELRRGRDPETGRGDRLVLTYVGDGKEASLEIPFFVVLCAPSDESRDCVRG